ncbi:Uu.00g120760.m01.CDS01 [Anthostomella pinea]|uniref:Uu.00g120760.m01.CDS01 n=1 Tax=Anthostomella pinea TaxID=933095 RepID=A0AAI8YHD7_9PEZI|nr:Uu.00g120760.m01.CDS01 [Anthostomella pinea]
MSDSKTMPRKVLTRSKIEEAQALMLKLPGFRFSLSSNTRIASRKLCVWKLLLINPDSPDLYDATVSTIRSNLNLMIDHCLDAPMPTSDLLSDLLSTISSDLLSALSSDLSSDLLSDHILDMASTRLATNCSYWSHTTKSSAYFLKLLSDELTQKVDCLDEFLRSAGDASEVNSERDNALRAENLELRKAIDEERSNHRKTSAQVSELHNVIQHERRSHRAKIRSLLFPA